LFKEVPTKVDFPSQEETILQYWEAKDIFQRSITQRKNAPYWVFYDGPPGTNGQPHVGHMMQSALKDLFGRYRAMKGFQVLRKAGWDTHGLPIELTAERELKLKSKRDIEKYGVENYIEYCRNTVFRYKKDWEDAIRRIGRFIDLENAYATLTKDYIQSDWWTIKNIWRPSPEMREKLGLNPQESLLYKDYRISPYCHRCGTTLSNFETAQGYKDTVDFALFPKFRSAKDPNLYYVAWTTTAWTLL
jgi:isoleucyl-tRNA synthetase